jgi:hypothetical protein
MSFDIPVFCIQGFSNVSRWADIRQHSIFTAAVRLHRIIRSAAGRCCIHSACSGAVRLIFSG